MWRTQNKMSCHKALCHVTIHMHTHILYKIHCSCSLSLLQGHSLRWQLSLGNVLSLDFPLEPFPWDRFFLYHRLNHANFKLEAVTSNWFLEAEEKKEMFGAWCERRQQCNKHPQNHPRVFCISEALEICIALFTSLNISALLIPTLIPTVTSLVALDFCVVSRTMAPFWTYPVISSNRTKICSSKKHKYYK